MSLFPSPPQSTKLARHRQLSPKAGVHVSPLQLGAMSIGDKWHVAGFGEMNKESSFKLLDAFYEAGGNFIDTANIYQSGSSEEFIGEWMEERKIRDQMVIATKYSADIFMGRSDIKQHGVFTGNSVKSMAVSLKESLKRLRTDYVDIFYVHWWDWGTSIEEVMNGLHNFILSGKVLYLGISDTPAWVVAEANRYALDHGKTPFCIYQGRWNIMDRAFEREIIPMARAHGMALAPWDVLVSGKLRTDAEEERRRQTGEKGREIPGFSESGWERTELQVKMSHALEKVAKEVGTDHITAVAIAYVMQKTPYVFPIVGGRKVEHLMGNLEALDIVLSAEQIAELEAVVPLDAGFPTSMIGDGTKVSPQMARAAHFDKVTALQALRPAKGQ